jgi:pyrimidine-specific ribonucleoside hydrolase
MNRIPVILDVDTGLDDALAILLVSDLAQLELIGIACVNGNASVEDTYRNTRFIAKLLNLKCPISKGAACPMINKVLHAKEAHGSYGLGNLKVEMDPEKHILPASQMYLKVLTEALEPVTIIATGPLTNLAHLMINHPELKKKIKMISFMGGSLTQGNVTPYAEFNTHADPEAMSVILKSEIPLVMAGLNITSDLRIKPEAALKVIKDPTETQKIFIDFLEFYAQSAFYTHENKGAALHDSTAVADVAFPEAFEKSLKSIIVDVSKDERRGQTREEGESLSVLVLTSVDLKFMVNLTVESIHHLRRTE